MVEEFNIPKEKWSSLLHIALKGKANDIYFSLSVDSRANYDILKSNILKSYQLLPEAYRRKFRECTKIKDETFVQFSKRKEILFDRWCQAEEVKDDFQNLKNMMLLEEFKNCIPKNVKTHLNDKEYKTLEEAALIADKYDLNHNENNKSDNSNKNANSGNKNSFNAVNNTFQSRTDSVAKNQGPSTNKKDIQCTYCKKWGHSYTVCYYLKNRNSNTHQRRNNEVRPTGLISNKSDSYSVIKNLVPDIPQAHDKRKHDFQNYKEAEAQEKRLKPLPSKKIRADPQNVGKQFQNNGIEESGNMESFKPFLSVGSASLITEK